MGCSKTISYLNTEVILKSDSLGNHRKTYFRMRISLSLKAVYSSPPPPPLLLTSLTVALYAVFRFKDTFNMSICQSSGVALGGSNQISGGSGATPASPLAPPPPPPTQPPPTPQMEHRRPAEEQTPANRVYRPAW